MQQKYNQFDFRTFNHILCIAQLKRFAVYIINKQSNWYENYTLNDLIYICTC